MRLIDVDQFKDKLLSFMDRKAPTPSDTDCILDGVINLLEEQPTIDPVKHGHWKFAKDVYVSCSVCGVTILLFNAENPNYCPHCGAKMEGEAE